MISVFGCITNSSLALVLVITTYKRSAVNDIYLR